MPPPLVPVPISPPTRVGVPEFDEETTRVYARALAALDDDGLDFVVGGALAMQHHTGIWRDTKDLDVFCRPADWARALAALERRGFRPEVIYESWLAKAWERDVFVDLIWRNANGLFPVTDGWVRDAVWGEVAGRDVRLLAAEELMLSKITVAGRHRFDGADVLHLLHATATRLDWDRLARGAGEHVGLIAAYLHMYRWGYPGAAPERVPEGVLARFEREARLARSSFGPFRARLLDLNTFLVDVRDWGLPDPHEKALADIFGTHVGHE